MNLVLIGCEYAGKSSIGINWCNWWAEQTGEREGLHDHFVVPYLSFHPFPPDDIDLTPDHERWADQVLILEPSFLGSHMHYMNTYHLQHLDQDAVDCGLWLINWYFADAVYAPLYYGYGGPGEKFDQTRLVRYFDRKVMEAAPETVLVLVKASADAILRRMHDNPRPRCILEENE